ncbi:hypothetical protein [Vreelandella stevensii]|uniref:hypothetical protein n=1 Tax=Vreelandella stevensii TaxID=502821 RepID=UPI00403AF767
MPPLLPEYLSQPLDVAIQSFPSTDWWPIWFAAIATLLGSFGGAWVGGRYAYKSTVKANAELLKRQRLEEALTIVNDMRDKIVRLSPDVRKFDDTKIDEEQCNNLRRHAAEFNSLQIPRLKALFLLSDSRLRSQAFILEAELTFLKVEITCLAEGGQNTSKNKEQAETHLKAVRARLVRLINFLVEILKISH